VFFRSRQMLCSNPGADQVLQARRGMQTIARRDGDEWVITGENR